VALEKLLDGALGAALGGRDQGALAGARPARRFA
jgi:hypothetical protein